MPESPHLIEKEIKSTLSTGYLSTGFDARIGALLDDFPISDSQNFIRFQKVLRELNRRLDHHGLSVFIRGPVDAGFSPLEVSGFFSDVSTIGTDDFLLLSSGGPFLLLNGSSKLIVTPDN
jgi:hypothetical protein